MRQVDGTLLYLHSDHLGSTSLVTKADGTTQTNQRYLAYGHQRDTGTVVTDHKSTSQKLDATGLYYYNARYYDPEIGQFISPDPLVPDPSSLLAYNRYLYVAGNPMRLTDSSGHYWETIADAVSVGYDVYDIYQNGLTWSSGGALVADVVSVALPVPGPGTCVRWCDDAWQYGNKAVGWVGDKADEGWQAAKSVIGWSDEVAGTGIGRWTRHNEVVDPAVVQQAAGNWCVLACGEMLSNARVTQQKLSKLVGMVPGGTDPADVAAAMNILDSTASGTWVGGYINASPVNALNALNNTGSWAAMMQIDGGHHMVVVDGINAAGMVMIRDPYGATKYNMLLDEFLNYWNGVAIFSQ